MRAIGPEKTFEYRIKKCIKDNGGWLVKFFANRMTPSGIPDILACIGGYFVAIEVKAQHGVPSELQLHQIRKIRDAGGFAFIVYPSGFSQLEKIINDLKQGYFTENTPEVLK